MIGNHNRCSRFSDEKINDGVKTKKTFTLNNASGSTVINSEYLDGFQYSTNGSMIIAQALQQTDDNTLSAKTASEEEVFREVDDDTGNIVPDSQIAMVLSFFPTAEGFYDYRKKQYIYQYKDHLGNVRSSYAKNKTSGVIEILDRNDYYPFGMNFYSYFGSAYDAKGTPFNYKYNGKELQETGMYDYGARMYMPDIGRWGVVDNKAEKYFSFSSYSYGINNPIKYLDPDGNDVIPWFVNSYKDNGKMRATKNYATKEFIKAMTDFARTDYGKSYLLQFMKKGQSIFGLKASTSGKHSNKNLNLVNLNLRYATPMERGNTFISNSGGVMGGEIVLPYIDKRTGKKEENVNVYFDTLGLDQFELGETIAHELALHGSNFEDYAEAVANNESTDNLSNSDEEHRAIGTQNKSNKNFRNYKWVMEQLKAANAKYEYIEKREQKKYEDIYKINNKK